MVESGRPWEKVESVRVPKNCPDEYLKTLESGWVQENDKIRASTSERWNPYEYRKSVRKVYKKMVESVWVPENGIIRASTEKM